MYNYLFNLLNPYWSAKSTVKLSCEGTSSEYGAPLQNPASDLNECVSDQQ